MPSYVDHLTSDITNTAIVSHVKNCEDCRRILAAMQAPESLPEKDPVDASTIDFLKKNRKKKPEPDSGLGLNGCSLAFRILGMESIHFPTFHDGYIHDELFCDRDRFQKNPD